MLEASSIFTDHLFAVVVLSGHRSCPIQHSPPHVTVIFHLPMPVAILPSPLFQSHRRHAHHPIPLAIFIISSAHHRPPSPFFFAGEDSKPTLLLPTAAAIILVHRLPHLCRSTSHGHPWPPATLTCSTFATTDHARPSPFSTFEMTPSASPSPIIVTGPFPTAIFSMVHHHHLLSTAAERHHFFPRCPFISSIFSLAGHPSCCHWPSQDIITDRPIHHSIFSGLTNIVTTLPPSPA